MNLSLYWLQQSLAVLPLITLVYLGTGLPVTLLLLPRSDWSQRATVACLTLISGSTLLTLWMFFIGTTGAAQDNYNLTMGSILAGVGIIAIIGWLALGWKLRSTSKASNIKAYTTGI